MTPNPRILTKAIYDTSGIDREMITPGTSGVMTQVVMRFNGTQKAIGKLPHICRNLYSQRE